MLETTPQHAAATPGRSRWGTSGMAAVEGGDLEAATRAARPQQPPPPLPGGGAADAAPRGGEALLASSPAKASNAAPSNGVSGESSSSSSGGDRSTTKWMVLAILVVQNSAATLLVSRSRSHGAVWNSQTAVILQEAIKAVLCIFLLLWEGGCSALKEALEPGAEALKTSIPALLYLFQNNMQYFAASYLDASTFAVLYQLKILTAALLSVMILGKSLSLGQWLALCLLTAGASTVLVAPLVEGPSVSGAPASRSTLLPGVIAILGACMASGLAGVYFEKLLKGSCLSLWARNLQLALYSLLIGVGSLWQTEGATIFGWNFIRGYTTVVWLAVANNAVGGLLVAVVIKYADTILKNFSTTLSILATMMVSTLCFGAPLSPLSIIGTVAVIYAVFLYGGMGNLGHLCTLVGSPSDRAKEQEAARQELWKARAEEVRRSSEPGDAAAQAEKLHRILEKVGG